MYKFACACDSKSVSVRLFALGRKERKNKVGTRPTVAMIYNKGNTLICELRRNFLIFPFILIYFWSNFRFDFAEGKKICFEQRSDKY